MGILNTFESLPEIIKNLLIADPKEELLKEFFNLDNEKLKILNQVEKIEKIILNLFEMNNKDQQLIKNFFFNQRMNYLFLINFL